MKEYLYNKLARCLAALIVACVLLLPAGCLITVSHYEGGKVTSVWGADCSFDCIYPINEGESFSLTFNAVAHARNEFVRWNDSLGDNYSICKRPTQPECLIEVIDLHEVFEGLTLDVEAQFRSVTGYNVNSIQFIEMPVTNRGFLKIGDERWFEFYRPGSVTYYYSQVSTAADSFGLYDSTRDYYLYFDLVSGEVREQFGALPTGPAPISQISSLSAKLTGYRVSRVAYGHANGTRQGEYIQVGASSWVDRVRGKKGGTFTFKEEGRDDTSVYLLDESRNVQVRLNVQDGLVYSSGSVNPDNPIAIIQSLSPPSSGWNASSVSYTDGSVEILGSFTERGESVWVETMLDKDIPAVLYELTSRDANVITLLDPLNDIQIRLDLLNGVVTAKPRPFGQQLEKYTIVQAM